MNINNVNLIGNIGKIEARKAKNDKEFIIISLATNKNITDANGNKAQKTEWHSLMAFSPVLVDIAKKLGKGDLITVYGELAYSSSSSEDNKNKEGAKTHKSAYIKINRLAKIQALNDKLDDSVNDEFIDENMPF